MLPPGDAVEQVLGDAQIEAFYDRVEQREPLRVLTAVVLQVVVLLNVGLERRHLVGDRERFAAGGERHEVHLRGVFRDVDEIVRRRVPIGILRERIAGVPVRVGVEER